MLTVRVRNFAGLQRKTRKELIYLVSSVCNIAYISFWNLSLIVVDGKPMVCYKFLTEISRTGIFMAKITAEGLTT